MFQNTRVTGIEVDGGQGACGGDREGPDRGRGGRQRRRHVRRRDRADGRGARARDPVRPPVPGHAAGPRARRRAAAADAARSRPAHLLPRGRRRARDGRLRARLAARLPALRARRARRDPARLQRPPARGRLGPVRGDHRELEGPRAGDGRGQDHQADQRPRGVHPRQRVLPRRVGGAGLLRRRRLLRPRPRRRRRDRPGDRGVDRRGRAQPRPLGDGRAPVRRPVPLAVVTPTPASARPTRPTTTSAIRTTSAPPAGRCGSRPPTRGIATTMPRSARSRAGSGSTGTSPTPAPATSRCGRAAGPAGTGRRRSAPSTAPPARRWRSSTRARSRSSRSQGPGAAGLLERLCDNRVARDVGQITYTQMLNRARRDRVRLHGRAAGAGAVSDRHRDRVRKPRSRVDPQAPARGRQRRASAT